MGQLDLALRIAKKENYLSELRRSFKDETVLLGVGDLNTFKGINLKLLFSKWMLKLHP